MALTFQFSDIVGTTTTPVYADLDNGAATPPTHALDFKSVLASGVAESAEAIARQDLRSFPLFYALHATGVFSTCTSVMTWLSDVDVSDLGTGAAINGTVVASYAEPADNSDIGAAAMPTSSATALDISQAGAGTIAVGTAGYSKPCKMQLVVGVDATIGTYTDLATINITYVET